MTNLEDVGGVASGRRWDGIGVVEVKIFVITIAAVTVEAVAAATSASGRLLVGRRLLYEVLHHLGKAQGARFWLAVVPVLLSRFADELLRRGDLEHAGELALKQPLQARFLGRFHRISGPRRSPGIDRLDLHRERHRLRNRSTASPPLPPNANENLLLLALQRLHSQEHIGIPKTSKAINESQNAKSRLKKKRNQR